MADNKDKKVLKSSIEREQSQTCLNSAEREKIKGSTNLNVPHLRFPEFSGEWECSTIGSEFELYSGNTPSRLDKEQFNGNVNWISSGELKEHYIYDTKEKITEEAASCNNLRLLPIGTFVIAIYGLEAEGVRGTGSVIQKKSTISQACMAFSSKGAITNEFLYSWYKKHGNLIGLKYAQGTKQQNLSYDIISQFRISYPSITEQKKLEDFISLIDERIATQNKIIEKLESLIKGLSQRLLSPKQGWTSYKLDELCQIKSGYSGIQVSFQTAYKVSRIETISNHCINMSRIGFVKEIPQEYKLRVGDILFSNINSVQYIGNTAFIDKDYGLYHGMNLLRIVPDSRIVFPRFIHLLLCSERLLRHFQSICNKAVSQASINQTSLGKTIITIPSYKEQQHICSIIESVERKLDIETSLLKMLQYQKQYLLRQMFI